MKIRHIIFSTFITVLIVASTALCVEAQCGQDRPFKQVAERSTTNIDTERFLNHIRDEFAGAFKGYAVILTGSAGRRLGFRREGWAVDPCDGNGVQFDLNTESAIGSVTKLFTTITVLKATPRVDLQEPFLKAKGLPERPSRLKRSLTNFLPNRWRSLADPFYDDVTIEELLQHKGGFERSGGGTHIATRLANGRERSAADYAESPRKYSNTSMGIFHFIYAKYDKPTSLDDVELEHQNSTFDTYNAEVQKITSAAFNYGLYKYILKPLRISATCDPQIHEFPPHNSFKSLPNPSIEYFPFHSVARSYASPSDPNGALLNSSMQNCAAGGLYMSAKDLAKFAASLGDADFLPEYYQNRMMNSGPKEDLYAFLTIDENVTGGRAFWHNGKRIKNGNVSYALLIRFASGATAVFVANSDNEGTNTRDTIRDAYNLARK